jgi:hypothetical protein
MAVQDFECQIARAQIGRYLQGDALSTEAVNQLETHIARCPGCKEAVTSKRKALQAMLGWSPEGETGAQTAVVEHSSPRQAEATVRDKAAAQLKGAIAVTKKPGQGSMWKPLALSAALAGILIAMSYMTRGNTSVLGGKVSEALPSSTTITPPAPVATEPAVVDAGTISSEASKAPITTVQSGAPTPESIGGEANSASESEPNVQVPSPAPAIQTAPAKPASPIVRKPNAPSVRVRRSAPRKTTKPNAIKPDAQSAPRNNSIRVYDEDGNPIR